MSTVNIPINKIDGWTEITTSGSGFFSSTRYCQYCISENQPNELFVGHRLSTSENKRYTLSSPSKLFMKGNDRTVIVLTEDL